ncbi:hypothetical protein IM543_13855 [Massilia sp. UMI-21]|nr:hypothetical protein IM543_13855 [Massilia sp. UMI-21]
MKQLVLAALLLAGNSAVHAGGSASATMEMSFVIRAACSVQATPSAPQVACTEGTVYQVRREAPAADSQTTPQAVLAGDHWQVVF